MKSEVARQKLPITIAIQNFLGACEGRNLSRATIDWYRCVLNRFAKVTDEVPTLPEVIDKYLSNINGEPETRHSHFRALRAFYNFVSSRYNSANPIKKISPPRVPKKLMSTLEYYELHGLLNSASTLRDIAIITLLIDTGIRTSEVINLRRQDIREQTIVVTGKTGQREIPISQEPLILLRKLIILNGDKDYIFWGHKGRLTRSGVYQLIKDCMKKAGIAGPKHGAHRIRHAFGKGWLVNGGDIRSLQQIMGHANILTTEKYASLNLHDTIDKHSRFTPLRSAHAAAQQSFIHTTEATKEAGTVINERRSTTR